MSDGPRLRQAWAAALNDAQNQFRSLLTSSSSSAWKRVSSPPKDIPTATQPVPAVEDDAQVVIHKRQGHGGLIMRAVLDVPIESDAHFGMESWKAVLTTPEMRKEWDPSVENAQLVEMFDPTTRISKTNFTLGWPANPRDAITISRTFSDATTLIDLSTSLPRSVDEPAYLRPAPPYVRSHVHILAWCVQLVNHSSSPPTTVLADSTPKRGTSPPKLRITCFWHHDLKVASWGFGSSSGVSTHLSALLVELTKVVKKRGARVPIMNAYGLGIGIENVTFNSGRDALTIEYAIVSEDEDDGTKGHALTGMDELRALKEYRRLERSLECSLPAMQGWDIQVSTYAPTADIAALPWTVSVLRPGQADQHLLFRIKHAALPTNQAVLKVKLVIEFAGSSAALRLNGSVQKVESMQERDPASFTLSQQMFQDASSVTDLSFHSVSSAASGTAASSAASKRISLLRNGSERTQNAEKSVLTLVRRNYVYFASLLQEPEAKWKPLAEARGVSVSQLDSIDPTLVVYRAEATFVGVGLWDLLSTVATPGARIHWDKSYDEAILLEDVNDLTELWHHKTKPAWPVNARDSVLLKTAYKSPTSVHVFSFSSDESQLFPNIPLPDPATIRTQVDLRGWAIESLSPNTTMLTLIEQSDPKGWSNKSSIPQQMIADLAGVGEFSIKCGGPPMATRLGGAKCSSMRYDHDRGIFKIGYRGSESRRTAVTQSSHGTPSSSVIDLNAAPDPAAPTAPPNLRPFIECELRCDLDTWASSLELVIDPPPQTVSCLRRHRLSESGGGLWITIEHDAVFVGEDRLMVTVRKGSSSSKEKGSVIVNSVKVKVDVQELPEQAIKALVKRKRVKPARIPLDQPPVLGVIRKRRAQWAAADEGESGADSAPDNKALKRISASGTSTPSGSRYPSPWAQYFTQAVEQATTSAAAAANAAVAAVSTPYTTLLEKSIPSSEKLPMHHALDALSYTRVIHSQTLDDTWTLVSDLGGLAIHRKLDPDISTVIPLHRGTKVIEGVSAEEIANAVTIYDCRKQWDDRFDQAVKFEEYGFGCHTEFIVNKGGFPFRDRGFYVASLVARLINRRVTTANGGGRSTPAANPTIIFCASASYNPELTPGFVAAKYNPHALPIGRLLIQGWILETLDPYTTENYTIPSTRCTLISAVDYSGSAPVAYNTMINASLPKSILALEAYVKGSTPLPVMRLPNPILAMNSENGVVGVKGVDGVEEGWALENSVDKGETTPKFISTIYTAITKKYRSKIFIPPTRPAASPVQSTATTEDKTPTPSRIFNNRNSGTPDRSSSPSPSMDLGEFIRHQRQSSLSARALNGSPVSSRPASPAGIPGHVRKSSLLKPTAASSETVAGDLLAGEVVVDSKLYPDGFEVMLAAAIKTSEELISLSPTLRVEQPTLPFACNVYALPYSPLQSSFLSTDKPSTRYLVRVTLPTSRYNIGSLEDPLTGETHIAPPKPQWLKDLEMSGAVVDIILRPAVKSTIPGSSTFSVLVDGVPTEVANEKKAWNMLGKSELEDDKLSKAPRLTRVPLVKGADTIPSALSKPLAVSRQFMDDKPLVTDTPDITTTPRLGAQELVTSTPPDATPDVAAPSAPAPSTTTGFMRFFNAYPHSLLRLTSPLAEGAAPSTLPVSKPASIKSDRSRAPSVHAPDGPVDLEVSTHSSLSSSSMERQERRFTGWTVLAIAVISFLLGSLMRSLLSPADFVYIGEQQDVIEEGEQWREVKRLVEVKYIVGGWDFLVAIVRRH